MTRCCGRTRDCCGCWQSGSIPAGICGFIFGKQAETTWRSPFVIGVMLMAVGVLMWMGERMGARKKDMAG